MSKLYSSIGGRARKPEKIYGLIKAERVGFGFQTVINYGSKPKKPSFSFLNLKKIMALSREK